MSHLFLIISVAYLGFTQFRQGEGSGNPLQYSCPENPRMEKPGRLQSKESDMTERLYFHFSLACIGEGNGNPLQCSCLENPRDRAGPGGLPSMRLHRVGHD